jgi:lipopolysaccharide/colanic/teichoic acid biosynthesis glycosyltransferase
MLQKSQSKRSDRHPITIVAGRQLTETAAMVDPDTRVAYLGPKQESAYCRLWKRLIDVAAASVGLVALAPLLIITGLLIKWTSRGSVLFWQNRVGRGGRQFRIAKFRSMVAGADKKGPDITSSGDCRVTPLGVILRRSKIDELPQLWNVLIGEMSLVGPRPEMPRYVAGYTEDQRRVLRVRPGITDLASIHYRNEEKALAKSENAEEFYRNVILPHKLDLNLEYIDKMSLLFDAKLVFQTLKSLIV